LVFQALDQIIWRKPVSGAASELALEYISAVGRKRFDRLAELIHPDASTNPSSS
jgi:hypothetical protein